jgi:NAD-dependent dihydropyrimidine dehydrogenase PreA subunit
MKKTKYVCYVCVEVPGYGAFELAISEETNSVVNMEDYIEVVRKGACSIASGSE